MTLARSFAFLSGLVLAMLGGCLASLNPPLEPAAADAVVLAAAVSPGCTSMIAGLEPAPSLPDPAQVAALAERLSGYITRRARERPGHGPTLGLSRYRAQYMGLRYGEEPFICGRFVDRAFISDTTAFQTSLFSLAGGGGRVFDVLYAPLREEFVGLERSQLDLVCADSAGRWPPCDTR